MKASRLFVCAVLLCGFVISNLVAAQKTDSAAKPKTYAVVGYYKGAKPAPELIEKVMNEVSTKVQGATLVQDANAATRVVNVVFKAKGYDIDLDGPSPRAMEFSDQQIDDGARINAMVTTAASVENTGGHGRGK